MKLTTTHAQYWRERQREPRWLGQVYADASLRHRLYAPRRRTVSIDLIINANGGGLSRPLDATNLCQILRVAYRRAGMPAVREILERAAGPNHYSTDTKQRRRYARHWLRKLNRT